LRHRRRLNTQTIRKRRPTGTHPQIRAAQKKSGTVKFFKFIFYLVILAGAGYAGYTYLLPAFSATTLLDSAENTPVQEEFPVATNPETETGTQLTPIEKKIQVEVLNGCGEQGIAKILADRIIKNNYDVVNSGNYIEDGKTNFRVPQTKIIDQLKTAENVTRAKDLAELIGIESSFVESFENPSPIADITIVIGQDFKTLPVFKKD